MQASVIRGFAIMWGYNFPELQLPDAELVRCFQRMAEKTCALAALPVDKQDNPG